MDLGIRDRVAFVAAASKGLGKAVALELAREGATVVICARNEDVLMRARDEITEATGTRVDAFAADVTDQDRVNEVVQQVIEEFSRLDILVCNAGGPPAGPVHDFGVNDYQSALDLNLISTVSLCYAAIGQMKEQGWGRIVNITSVSAKQPIDTLILSNTARAGVLGFAKSLSNQLAPYGITVNSVCPGYTRTERVEGLAESFADQGKGTVEDFYTSVEEHIPAGRLGDPRELAQAVVFLASEAAGYITGVALQVDGGYTRGLF